MMLPILKPGRRVAMKCKQKEEEIAPSRRERLTLTQLAGYDDILTDALVDHVSTIERTVSASGH